MNEMDFNKSLIKGEMGEKLAHMYLEGTVLWDQCDTDTVKLDYSKRCIIQKWDNVTKDHRLWKLDDIDFMVSFGYCPICKLRNVCESALLYPTPMEPQAHEVKTNYRTYIGDTEKGKLPTQNIFIETIENRRKYEANKKAGKLITYKGIEIIEGVGWWGKPHASWYHFFQPFEYFDEGKPIGPAIHASNEEIIAWENDKRVEAGDTLITAVPWGFFLSITGEMLQSIIDNENPREVSAYNNSTESRGLILSVFNVLEKYHNYQTVKYVPIFEERIREGEVQGIRKRWIPERLHNYIANRITGSKAIKVGLQAIELLKTQGITIETNEPQGIMLLVQNEEPMSCMKSQFWEDDKGIKRNDTPHQMMTDLSFMEVFKG